MPMRSSEQIIFFLGALGNICRFLGLSSSAFRVGGERLHHEAAVLLNLTAPKMDEGGFSKGSLGSPYLGRTQRPCVSPHCQQGIFRAAKVSGQRRAWAALALIWGPGGSNHGCCGVIFRSEEGHVTLTWVGKDGKGYPAGESPKEEADVSTYLPPISAAGVRNISQLPAHLKLNALHIPRRIFEIFI